MSTLMQASRVEDLGFFCISAFRAEGGGERHTGARISEREKNDRSWKNTQVARPCCRHET